MRTGRFCLTVILSALAMGGVSPALGAVEQTGRDQLRVCADGNALPFSHEDGTGFENRLAEMIAADLKVPVAYTWWPQTLGFVRQTLGARRCDLVIGTASGELLMQNTNPYYRSVYALVYRADAGLTAGSLADPALQGARIGVVAQTPPVDVLVRHGLTNIEPYQLATDTRVHQPARDAVADVAAGRTDAAVIWGPLAGYWAARQDVKLKVVPLAADAASARLAFNISMGIRPDEPEWKHWLNGWIKANQPRIDALLAEYGVPLLDRQGRLIQPRPAEPAGYRTSEYQAPVPATLAGATVLTPDGLIRLMGMEPKPLLLDVLPVLAQRPEGGEPEQEASGDWMPRPHETIPGSIWLPDMGRGDLSPAQADRFRQTLMKLTGGDKDRRLVLFCRRDCWMSWNAAKRALEWGYGNVFWYPEGVEGWLDAGRALAVAEPYSTGMGG